MANRTETAAVTGETIKLSSNDAGAAGSFNAVSLAFTFDSAWDGTTKTVQFLDTYGNNPVNRPLTVELLVSGAYIVPIPAEPLVYAGEITVTVRGVDLATDDTTAERIIVSASTTMKVKHSDYRVGGATPVEPTLTQTELLQAEIDDIKATIANAEASATAAALSETAAELAETHAELAEANAEAAQAAAELVVMGFDTHAAGKQTDFDNNATTKTTTFNDNVTSKTSAFNDNATSKTSAFDLNAANANTTIDGKVTIATDAADDAQTAQGLADGARDDSIAAKNAAESAQQKIENMTASASGLAEGATPTVTKSVVGGVVNLVFGLPVGATGATGATGKTAYASAQEGGYTDTEANFYADLGAVYGLKTVLEALL